MKILFLDDSLDRHAQFRFDGACLVFTADECIQKLKESTWDLVCLDHDLGNQTFVNSADRNCGMEVVRWMEQNKPKIYLNIVIVHSWNGSANKEMSKRLADVGYSVATGMFGPTMLDYVEDLIEKYGEECSANQKT